VKRFIVALIILAGALAAAALAIPTNAATVNGTAISQDQVNSDVTAIANSKPYQCFLNAEAYLQSGGQSLPAPVDGAGSTPASALHPTATTAFVAPYVDTEISHVTVMSLAATRGITVSPSDVKSATAELNREISQTMTSVAQDTQDVRVTCGASTPLTGAAVLKTMPPSFVHELATFDATVGALEDALSGANDTAKVKAYFSANQSKFDTVCFTDAEYSSQSAAQAAAQQVASGTSFDQVASAASGGPQGCQVLYGIANQLSSVINLNTLALNTVSAPFDVGGTYILLEMTSRTPTAFDAAKSSVVAALKQTGAQKAETLLEAVEKRASIHVNPAYGTWVAPVAQVAVPTTPPVPDVLNPSANLATSASSTARSG